MLTFEGLAFGGQANGSQKRYLRQTGSFSELTDLSELIWSSSPKGVDFNGE
ncbi:hypothetical protein SAMN05444162_3505 [Paenibacillaceae bacterium GAS479]|nr:hypothetical protein SAMN05444162_3505 [Paenibacillaceae bacterium GAS479]